MPVFSYLAYPEKGSLKDLSALEYCEVMAADNRDLLILVTDTPNDDAERALQNKLRTRNHCNR